MGPMGTAILDPNTPSEYRRCAASAQCVGLPAPSGGIGTARNYHDSGYLRKKGYTELGPNDRPMPDDVLIWTKGSAGHVGFYVEDAEGNGYYASNYQGTQVIRPVDNFDTLHIYRPPGGASATGVAWTPGRGATRRPAAPAAPAAPARSAPARSYTAPTAAPVVRRAEQAGRVQSAREALQVFPWSR